MEVESGMRDAIEAAVRLNAAGAAPGISDAEGDALGAAEWEAGEAAGRAPCLRATDAMAAVGFVIDDMERFGPQ